jgi:hypothetical protein
MGLIRGTVSREGSFTEHGGNGKDEAMRLGSSAGCATLMLLILALPFGPVRAQEVAETPAVCRVGVNIEDLYDFDLTRETFGAVLWLWSLCPAASATLAA